MAPRAPFKVLEQRGRNSGRLFWHILPWNLDRRYMSLLRILPEGWPLTREQRALVMTGWGLVVTLATGMVWWLVALRLMVWWVFP